MVSAEDWVCALCVQWRDIADYWQSLEMLVVSEISTFVCNIDVDNIGIGKKKHDVCDASLDVSFSNHLFLDEKWLKCCLTDLLLVLLSFLGDMRLKFSGKHS